MGIHTVQKMAENPLVLKSYIQVLVLLEASLESISLSTLFLEAEKHIIGEFVDSLLGYLF